METQTLINFIKSNVPHIHVSSQSIDTIAEHFEEITLERNEYLLKEGKTSGYFFLSEGFMRAFTHDADGNDITTSFHAAPKIVFEVTSFFLHVPSPENIQALTNCRGFYTTFEKLNNLFHTVPEFREFGRSILVKEFVALKHQMLINITKSAEKRYEEFVQSNKELLQFVQLKQIASFLGITDTSLSRIRREYVKKQ